MKKLGIGSLVAGILILADIHIFLLVIEDEIGPMTFFAFVLIVLGIVLLAIASGRPPHSPANPPNPTAPGTTHPTPPAPRNDSEASAQPAQKSWLALHIGAIILLLVITTGTDGARFTEAWQLLLYRAIPYAYAMWLIIRWSASRAPAPESTPAQPSDSQASQPAPQTPIPVGQIKVNITLQVVAIALFGLLGVGSLLMAIFEYEDGDMFIGGLVFSGIFLFVVVAAAFDIHSKTKRAKAAARSSRQHSPSTPPPSVPSVP